MPATVLTSGHPIVEETTRFFALWNLGPHEKIQALNRKSNNYVLTHLPKAVKGDIPFASVTSLCGNVLQHQ